MKGMLMKLKPGLMLIVLLAAALPAFSQTAAELEQLLDTGELTCAQAAWFTLASALESPPENPGAAFRYAREQGWLQKNAKAAEPINMGALSLLMAGAFDISGSFMYRLFPSPRYAYRELVSLRLIQGRADPGMRLAGKTFLEILNRVMVHTGTDAALAKKEEQRRILEEVSESLRGSAGKIQGCSGGTEDVGQYEGEFQLE
jgi:hypothetical protein